VLDHGKKRAVAIVRKGLRLAGTKETERNALPKSDSRKALLTLAIKRATGVPLRWVSVATRAKRRRRPNRAQRKRNCNERW
jgi:hypothetical protein